MMRKSIVVGDAPICGGRVLRYGGYGGYGGYGDPSFSISVTLWQKDGNESSMSALCER
ncbi:hypothetical protein BH10PSE18_BH10PSE18_27760 [soil metagenome]